MLDILTNIGLAVSSPSRTTPEKLYPISERFKCPQGEAQYAGTFMAFIRLAGCTVGKPYTKEERINQGLMVYQEQCHDAFGNGFACDTNYKLSEKLSISQLLEFVGESEHVCLTGGEPLMHDLDPLISALLEKGDKMVHVETSGTISLDKLLRLKTKYGPSRIWITVSPKGGFLSEAIEYANEVKVLVGDNFNLGQFLLEFTPAMNADKLWIQPINGEKTIDPVNCKRVLELQDRYPKLKISVQVHKVLNCR